MYGQNVYGFFIGFLLWKRHLNMISTNCKIVYFLYFYTLKYTVLVFTPVFNTVVNTRTLKNYHILFVNTSVSSLDKVHMCMSLLPVAWITDECSNEQGSKQLLMTNGYLISQVIKPAFVGRHCPYWKWLWTCRAELLQWSHASFIRHKITYVCYYTNLFLGLSKKFLEIITSLCCSEF